MENSIKFTKTWTKSKVRQEQDKFKAKNQPKENKKLKKARDVTEQERLDIFWEELTRDKPY